MIADDAVTLVGLELQVPLRRYFSGQGQIGAAQFFELEFAEREFISTRVITELKGWMHVVTVCSMSRTLKFRRSYTRAVVVGGH